MTLVESVRGRRLVGRLERGAHLVAGLIAVCRANRVQAGEVRARGWLSTVELRDYDGKRDAWSPPRRGAACALLHLDGRIRARDSGIHIDATCVLARGEHLSGGNLIDAEVHSIEFVIESWDDLPIEAARAASAPPAPAPPAVEEKPAAPAIVEKSMTDQSTNDWHDVIATSAQAGDTGDDLTKDPIRAGDVINHSKFGRCDVERVEGDQEFAQVRLRNGRLVRLSLDVLQLKRDGMEDGKRRWLAIPPK